MGQEPVMSREPLVTVVMNCYNGAKYLRQAVDSVLAQTYQNWEIVFWDNQSTDGSAEVFKAYTDPRLKYFYAPEHTWLYEARNYAIEKASGDFFAFLDVDDWWLPEKLEKQIALFSDPEVGFVCGNYWIVNELKNKNWTSLKNPISTGKVLEQLLKDFFVGLLTLVVRRSALASLDYAFDPRYHIIGDFDLVIRLAVDWKLDCVQQPIAFYRVHGSNETAKHRSRQIDELECWLQEMEKVDAIRSCANFGSVRTRVTYIKIMHMVLQADKKAAYMLLRDLPWSRLTFRLWVAFCLPAFVVQKFKNN
jgi:glycosyltransferase involved in cell wall biosynthesis